MGNGIGIVLFIAIAVVAVVGGIGMVVSRKAVHSALFLVLNLFCVALLYLTLNAEFLAAVQVIVYAGAIMVLFLFVITLLNPTQADGPDVLKSQAPLGILLACVLLLEVVAVVASGAFNKSVGAAFPPPPVPWGDNIQAIGGILFTTYLFPFEVTSILLLVAIVGATVLAKGRQH